MKLKIYLRRAIKFSCFFAAIYGLLLLLFYTFGSAELTISTQTIIGVVIFGVIYPLIGFHKKRIVCNTQTYSLARIKENIELCGYRCIEEQSNLMKFCYLQNIKKLFAAFEDTIEVRIEVDYIEIEGLRRDVTLLALRLSKKLNLNA